MRQRLYQVLGDKMHEPYEEQYRYIMQLIDNGKIKPVGTSPRNGKKPALHLEYWIIDEAKDYSAQEDELLYHTEAEISVDYYLHNPEVYLKEREAVRMLNTFFKDRSDRLQMPVSFNERCFEIWGYEKFLSKESGKTVLNHCGLSPECLNCYSTAEPIAYFTLSRIVPQKILVLENKDPFYSMRRHLLSGNTTILGEEIGTLIYGGGKRVVSSFKEYGISAEPYILAEENELLYFGDLDYEGIGIYEALADAFEKQGKIVPFVPAYLAMLDKAERAPRLPGTKEHQNRNIGNMFFSFFNENIVETMRRILEKDIYIPQEILNISDF